jgi:ABC-type multidrug transport system fused ATPase/permease subunit
MCRLSANDDSAEKGQGPEGYKVAETLEETKENDSSKVPTAPLTKVFLMCRPEIPMILISCVLLILSEACNLIIPMILAKAYDALIYTENKTNAEIMSSINGFMVLVIAIYFGGMLLGFLRTLILGIIGERLVARLRCKLYSSILKQEISFFDEHTTGELVSRLGSDTTLLQTVISFAIPEALTGLIKSITAIILMFVLSAKLAGLSLGGVIVIFLFSVPLGKKLGTLSSAYQDELSRAQTHSTEAFGSMRTVQSFAAEQKEINRFENKIGNPDDYPLFCKFWWPTMEKGGIRSTYRVGYFKSLYNSGFFTLIFGGGFGFLNISLWYGFYLISQGELTIGELTAFQTYVFNIGFGLGQVGSNAAKAIEGLAANGRVFQLLQRIPKIPKTSSDSGKLLEKSKKPSSMKGDIEFENVNFSYPSRPGSSVLIDFSLKIPSQTTTALVGSSGAGKSTIVALLQRFYDIDTGNIKIDQNDLTDLDLQWLRSKIGYVQQEPQLFGLSIRENLLYGVDREVSQSELEKSCIDANAHDFITSWKDGYDTLVGERGVKVSGGQKQRIAIARALLTNCSILLLDEATSALDAESEHLVQQAIDKAVIGRTVIVVAHRLSTIRTADQIVVMDDHRIVDVGTHEGLLETCLKYQDLIKRQNMK